jgi:hypothetical protein
MGNPASRTEEFAQLYHPLTVVNNSILNQVSTRLTSFDLFSQPFQYPEASIVVTHDDVWCSVLYEMVCCYP